MIASIDALREALARAGFAGWYGRDEYDEHPVQGMWERAVNAQLVGPLAPILAQAEADRAEVDQLRSVLDFEKRAKRVAEARLAALSGEVETLRAERDEARGQVAALREAIRIAAEAHRSVEELKRREDERLRRHPTIRGAALAPADNREGRTG